jgi:uncharacterized alpha/beta hydrolase family protein
MNINTYLSKKVILAALLFTVVLIASALSLFIFLQSQATLPKGNTTADSIQEKNNLIINISAIDPDVKTLTADSENRFAIRIMVRNAKGAPVQGAEVQLEAAIDNAAETEAKAEIETGTNPSASSSSAIKPYSSIVDTKAASDNDTAESKTPSASGKSAMIGTFYPASGLTDSNGIFNAEYAPPSSASDINQIKLSSNLVGTDKTSTFKIALIPVPVVFVHGYQASPDIFSGISAYMKTRGFNPLCPSYSSEKGVVEAAEELASFLDNTKNEMASSGIQIKRFDLVGHSMGGLVARYYTCGSEYLSRENVRKLIFLSVPQKGSPFASIGLKYYDNQGIRDLLTDSSLYSELLPSMTNGGLNPSIQTGSIMGRYDEVVSAESASLAQWGIKTELFDVGDSNFTIDKLLSGEILQAANHKLILYNRKVYQRVEEMLTTDLSYPSVK